MKNLVYSILGILVLVFTSCEEDKEDVYVINFNHLMKVATNNCFEDETFGFSIQVNNISEIANETLETQVKEFSANKNLNHNGVLGSYNYNFEYNANVNDNTISYTSTATGSYETVLMKSNDKIETNWNASNLDLNSDFINITGITKRNGDQYSKEYEDSINSEITFNTEDLVVNRITKKIKSGKINFTFTASSSYGNNYTGSGEIVYSDYKKVINYN